MHIDIQLNFFMYYLWTHNHAPTPTLTFQPTTMERPKYSSTPAMPRGGGELGLAIARVPEGILVSDKKTGSPAAYSQKLRVGDRIRKIDQVVVENLDVAHVRWMLMGAPFSSVDIELVCQHTRVAYSVVLQRAAATGWSARDPTPYRPTQEVPPSQIWTAMREATARVFDMGGDASSVRAKSQHGGDESSTRNGGAGFLSFNLALDLFNNREEAQVTKTTDQHALSPRAVALAHTLAPETRMLGSGSAPPMSPPHESTFESMRSHSRQLAPQQPIGMLLARHANSADPEAVVVDAIMAGSCAETSHPRIEMGDELLSVNGAGVCHVSPMRDVTCVMHACVMSSIRLTRWYVCGVSRE